MGLTNKEQSERTKKALWDAMFSMLEGEDLDHVTIRNVCQRAGVSNRTFYLYFSSKEAAVLECYETMQRQIWDSFDEDAVMGDDPWQNLLSIFRFQFQMVERRPDLAGLVLRCILKCAAEEGRTSETFIRERLREAVIACQEAGMLDSSQDAREVAQKLYSFSRGLQFELLAQTDEPADVEASVARCEEYLSCFTA